VPLRLAAVGVLCACFGGATPSEAPLPAGLIECAGRYPERPEICTREYVPVCGLRDTGIRCVTPPCPSGEWRTYGNACEACSDASVTGYTEGACAPPE
jgi:hypothetical protein